MFTETTDEQKKNAPIQAPALNSTIWGGLAATVGAVGAAMAGIFSAMNTNEWQVRVAIVGGVTLVVAAGLTAMVALIWNDSRVRMATTADAGAAKTASKIVWITPPSMHVYTTANPETALQVILVGVGEDEVYYLAAAKKGRPETLKSQQIGKVELGEHQFR